MLDIKWIREHPDKLKQALKKRGVKFDVDSLLKLDEKRRAKIKEADDFRARHNKISSEIPASGIKNRGLKIRAAKLLKDRLNKSESELKILEEEFNELMYKIPNIPAEDAPPGKDENDNKVIRTVGEIPKFNFKPKDYIEIAEKLDLIDVGRAAKVSGTRFGYLKREAALLEFALVNFSLDYLIPRGFIPVIPPVLIKEKMMRGMGYIDSKRDLKERYFLKKDGLFLVGTSEQSLGPMHADEVFDEDDLPLRYVAFSTCFRREAGSYGKDTQGILRVHQFDKVEMVTFSKPEDSRNEHELMLNIQEELMQALKIPYRVVKLCVGELAHPLALTYDLEAWLPGQNEGRGQYRETHSTSNTTDFQARRLNIKYKLKTPSPQLKSDYVHMLNGTAFAIGRMLIAILENYQEADGLVKVPALLQKYTKFKVIR